MAGSKSGCITHDNNHPLHKLDRADAIAMGVEVGWSEAMLQCDLPGAETFYDYGVGSEEKSFFVVQGAPPGRPSHLSHNYIATLCGGGAFGRKGAFGVSQTAGPWRLSRVQFCSGPACSRTLKLYIWLRGWLAVCVRGWLAVCVLGGIRKRLVRGRAHSDVLGRTWKP